MAINSKSKLREVLEDPRAVAVIEQYFPGFVSEKASQMGPVMEVPAGRPPEGNRR